MLAGMKHQFMNSRITKIFFSCAAALYISLVCFNNVVDYRSNFPFVAMVAKMEDTFSKERNGWRSVNDPAIHFLLFVLILICELTVAGLLWFGSFKMLQRRSAAADTFASAKKYSAAGYSLAVMLWFTVFIAIGGEWFLMWQSKKWNAQPTGFFLTCSFLLFLIYHNQQDM
jgi:predicted small integral membrane protein